LTTEGDTEEEELECFPTDNTEAMGEGIQWRRIMERVGILRPKGQRPSPWISCIGGSLGIIGGVTALLARPAEERWLWAALIVVGAAEVWYAVQRFRSKAYRMRGDKNQSSNEGRVMVITLVALFIALGAQDRGASFWMMLVIAAAVAAILTVLVELAVRALHHRPGRWL
jgi:hypothetical protein